MKLLDEWEVSEWAYWECKFGNNIKEIRKLITDNGLITWYCIHIKDVKKLWSKINDSYEASKYCCYIKDRPEVRKYITRPTDILMYEFTFKKKITT